MDNIIPLPKRKVSVAIGDPDEEQTWRRRGRPYTRRGPNMRTLLFRSSSLIAESDEADLIRDVGLAVDRAQTKLELIKRRLKSVQEQAAAQCSCLRRRKPS